MDEAKIHITVNVLIEVGNPKITISPLQAPYMVIAHTIVLRQDDFDGIASQLQFVRQPLDHISQTTNFGDRCALRGHHNDIHLLKPSLSGNNEDRHDHNSLKIPTLSDQLHRKERFITEVSNHERKHFCKMLLKYSASFASPGQERDATTLSQ
jgi:hypothetical protein